MNHQKNDLLCGGKSVKPFLLIIPIGVGKSYLDLPKEPPRGNYIPKKDSWWFVDVPLRNCPKHHRQGKKKHHQPSFIGDILSYVYFCLGRFPKIQKHPFNHPFLDRLSIIDHPAKISFMETPRYVISLMRPVPASLPAPLASWVPWLVPSPPRMLWDEKKGESGVFLW